MFTKDYKELVALLNETGVEYLVVGGYAVARHGYVRYTGDLDLWVKPSAENSGKTVAVLNAFGFGGLGIAKDAFAEGEKILQLGQPPWRVDLMNRISGVEFDSAFSRKLVLEMDGVWVNYIGLEDLLINKQASGRGQDLVDLEHLPKRKT